MQRPLQFFRDLRTLPTPADAPAKVLRQVDSPRMAMRLALMTCGVKHEAIAHAVGMSKGYFSKVVNEQMPMPEWFPMAFSYHTGQNVLRQYLALAEAMQDAHETQDWLERKLAAELRAVAA
jgi:hypothetical protein